MADDPSPIPELLSTNGSATYLQAKAIKAKLNEVDIDLG